MNAGVGTRAVVGGMSSMSCFLGTFLSSIQRTEAFVQVVAIRFSPYLVPAGAKSLQDFSELAQCILGVHFMANRVVLCVVDFPNDAATSAAVTAILQAELRGTWPVCTHIDGLISVCRVSRTNSFNLHCSSAQGCSSISMWSQRSSHPRCSFEPRAVLCWLEPADRLPMTQHMSGDCDMSVAASHMQYCKDATMIPRFLALREAVKSDVGARLKRYETINYALYAAARVPAAIVPFGVQVANFIDMLRLVRNMLIAVGMTDDALMEHSAADAGRKVLLQNALVGAMADVYTFMSGGAITLGLTTAAVAGDGLVTAMHAFAVMDPLVVGAVSLMAGAVSAVAAALTRPLMVRSLGELIASVQTMWLAFPTMRRSARTANVRHRCCVCCYCMCCCCFVPRESCSQLCAVHTSCGRHAVFRALHPTLKDLLANRTNWGTSVSSWKSGCSSYTCMAVSCFLLSSWHACRLPLSLPV
jgi:hypothetical protein